MNSELIQIEVKRLSPGDESIACAAVNSIRLEAEGKSYRVHVDYMQQFLSGESNYFIVACEGNIPLGYILGYQLPRFDRDKSMFYIHEVTVTESRRGEGIGRMLINTAIKLCNENEFIKMFLFTGKNNLPAVSLYLNTGGKPTPKDDPPEVFFWSFESK